MARALVEPPSRSSIGHRGAAGPDASASEQGCRTRHRRRPEGLRIWRKVQPWNAPADRRVGDLLREREGDIASSHLEVGKPLAQARARRSPRPSSSMVYRGTKTVYGQTIRGPSRQPPHHQSTISRRRGRGPSRPEFPPCWRAARSRRLAGRCSIICLPADEAPTKVPHRAVLPMTPACAGRGQSLTGTSTSSPAHHGSPVVRRYGDRSVPVASAVLKAARHHETRHHGAGRPAPSSSSTTPTSDHCGRHVAQSKFRTPGRVAFSPTRFYTMRAASTASQPVRGVTKKLKLGDA